MSIALVGMTLLGLALAATSPQRNGWKVGREKELGEPVPIDLALSLAANRAGIREGSSYQVTVTLTRLAGEPAPLSWRAVEPRGDAASLTLVLEIEEGSRKVTDRFNLGYPPPLGSVKISLERRSILPVGGVVKVRASLQSLNPDPNPANNAALLDLPIRGPKILFPQFADGGGTRSRLFLRNNGSQDEEVVVCFFDAKGAPTPVAIGGLEAAEHLVQVPARGARSVFTDGLGDLKIGSLALESDLLDASGLEADLAFVLFGGAVSLTSPIVRLRHQIFVVVSEDESTGLAIANPSLLSEARIEASLFGKQGDRLAATSITIPPGQQKALFLDEFPSFNFTGGFESGVFTLKSTNNVPVSVIGLIQNRSTGALVAISSSPNGQE